MSQGQNMLLEQTSYGSKRLTDLIIIVFGTGEIDLNQMQIICANSEAGAWRMHGDLIQFGTTC